MKGTIGRDVFVGGGGDDVILGYEGNDLMCGGPGHDMLVGGLDDDKGYGGPGNDGFLAFTGRDLSSGGPGLDATLHWYSFASVQVDLSKNVVRGEGTDRLKSIEDIGGSNNADSLRGDNRPNVVFGEGGDDIIKGNGGGDLILGQDGWNKMDGGPGKDVVSYFTFKTGVTVDLSTGYGSGQGGGQDSLRRIEGVEGSKHSDSLVGNAKNNFFYGGSDKAYDAITGGAGNDFVGDTSVRGEVSGGDGKDVLFAPNMRAYGDEGKDKIQSSKANGGPGDDFIYGSGYGKEGDDLFVHGRRYFGGTGDDVMFARTGSNVFGYDEDGVDPLLMGEDVVTYVEAKRPVDVDLGAGTAVHRNDPKGAKDKFLVSTFQIVGTRFNDTLAGTANADTLFGWKGEDALTGLEGNDLLNGGAQEDEADGGLGIDLCPKVETRTFCEDELQEVPVPAAALPGALDVVLSRYRTLLHRGRAPVSVSELAGSWVATAPGARPVGIGDMTGL